MTPISTDKMPKTTHAKAEMKAVVPKQLHHYYDDWQMSPGLACNGFVFFTGFTGSRADGSLSNDPKEQIHAVFDKISLVLEEAGLSFADIVEMTSHHVGLNQHLELFKSIRAEYVQQPYPAWTAIEVAGFVRKDAIVEIRVIARQPLISEAQ